MSNNFIFADLKMKVRIFENKLRTFLDSIPIDDDTLKKELAQMARVIINQDPENKLVLDFIKANLCTNFGEMDNCLICQKTKGVFVDVGIRKR